MQFSKTEAVFKFLLSWDDIYEILTKLDYVKAQNSTTEKYRKRKLLDKDVMLLMAALAVCGTLTQAKLGRTIRTQHDESKGANTGSNIRRWVEGYLEPMGLVKREVFYEKKVRCVCYSLTELGIELILSIEKDVFKGPIH